MTSAERFEAQLEHWLAETAQPRIPDDLPTLLAQTARVGQRPAWSFPERWIPMSELTMRRGAARTVPRRPVVVLVALLVLLVLTLALVVGGSRRPLPVPYGLAQNGFFVIAADGDLIALDPTTGTRRTLVGGPATDDRPVFSHDGTRIAFMRTTPDGTSLAVVHDDGSDVRILKAPTVDVSDHVEWSPDDRTLLVSAESRNIIPDPRSGAAHPMAIVPADGQTEARVLDVGMTAEMATWRPPIGDEILFRGETERGHALYVIDPAGGGPRRITPVTAGPFDYDLRIGWSADGQHLAFQRQPVDAQVMHLWVAEADGSGERLLTGHTGLAPIWSPDGTKIAYHSSENAWQLAVGDVGDQASERRLGTLLPDGWTMTWTPDGERIVLSPIGGLKLIVIDPDGGPPVTTSWEASRAPTYQRLPFEP